MIYTKFADLSLSMLGMGCMRFPTDAMGEVDMEKTEALIDLCIERGVNYFDTAWFYHNGKSEEIMGKLLAKYPRESFYIATKMPFNKFASRAEVEATFEEQLRRTGMSYFDFYLMHNVSDDTVSIFTDEKLGIAEFLCEQKKAGRIRHLGFSTHGTLPMMESFIGKYRDILEFCQIQLNWLDWQLQKAKEKVALLEKYGLPIWVMEPVRGGKLAKLADADEKMLKDARPDESIPAWAFRFIQSIPNVKMVLSGMSDRAQVEDNLKTFSELRPLSSEEENMLHAIAKNLIEKKTLTCTNCKYCVPECPRGLPIPKLLRIYNDAVLMPGATSVKASAISLPDGKHPADCIGCGACEQKCPQKIEISSVMEAFAAKLED